MIARGIMIGLSLLILLCPPSARADEASVQFEKANELYRAGNMQDASSAYEQIVQQGYESVELYYNLGNAYFKLGSIPAAILNYERASRLDPNDEDVAYNLRLANLRIIDRIEPLPLLFFVKWWRSLVNLASGDVWGILAIALLWGAAASGGVLVSTRLLTVRRLTFWFGALTLFCSICAFVLMSQRDAIERDANQAIVFLSSAPVKSAPDAQSTDLFVLHEGVKVYILDTVGAWKKIRLADGKVGWMMGDGVEVI